jgi:catechol 2,3-dioxygenase-like lactoylglutathione lyase family enzyme
VPGEGATTVPLRFTYSADGPQHIELLQGTPGSVWDGREQPGLHHVGLWSDDLVGETERMVAAGWTLRLAQRDPAEGYGAFTYVQPPSGLLVELVSSALKPMFDRWFAGGPLS